MPEGRKHPKLGAEALLLVPAIFYFGFVVTQVLPPLQPSLRPGPDVSSNERMEIVLQGQWKMDLLAKVVLFSKDGTFVWSSGQGELSLRIESPPGVAIPIGGWKWHLDGFGTMVLELEPPVRISRDFELILSAPANSGWKLGQIGNPWEFKPQRPAAFFLPPPPVMFPAGMTLLSTALFLQVLFWGRGLRGFLPSLFLISAGAMFWLSRDLWLVRVGTWWGEYWPDSYVEQASAFVHWMQGQIPWSETGLAQFRNGQSWVVPFLLAGLNLSGLPMETAFRAFSFLAILAAAGLGLYQLRRWNVDETGRAFFLVAFFSSFPILRSSAAMLTDAGGVFAVALFLFVFFRLLERPRDFRMVMGVAFTLALACQIRVGLVPLLMVPVVAGLWEFLRSNPQSPPAEKSRSAQSLALSGVLGALCLLTCWWALGVLESFEHARQFAQNEAFRSQFSWLLFGEKTAWTFAPLLLILLAAGVGGASGGLDVPFRITITLLASALGCIALLGLGKIIPWARYWAPAAYPIILLAASVSKNLPIPTKIVATILVLVVQMAWLFREDL